MGISANTFFGAIAIAFFGASAYAGHHYIRQQRIVPLPIVPAKFDEGPVRAWAQFAPENKAQVTPCLASWKSGKSFTYRTFNGDNLVTLETGRTLRLSSSTSIEFFQNEAPPNKWRVDGEGYWRKHHSRLYRSPMIHCVSDQEMVWVEGCVKDDTLVGCPGKTSNVLLTPRGPRHRRRYLMIHAHGAIALAFFGTAFLLLAIKAKGAVVRRLAADLAAKHGSTPADFAGAIAGMAGLVAIISLFPWVTFHAPWVSLGATTVLLLGCLIATIARFRMLDIARRILMDMQTSRLHDKQPGIRELAVRVAPDADLVQGFGRNEQYPFVQFKIKETFIKQNGSKKVETTREVASGSFPKEMKVYDQSGSGLIELEHCVLDAQSERNVSLDYLPEWFGEFFGPLSRSPEHKEYRVKYSFVKRADPLLIYGGVQRDRGGDMRASAEAQYREMPSTPTIRGTKSEPVLVHVGEETALLAVIEAARRARAISIVLTLFVMSAGAAAFWWILQI